MRKENNNKKIFPGACSCMTLTSKSGKHYWFRTCDIETDLWKEGAHVTCKRAGEEIVYGNGKKEISNEEIKLFRTVAFKESNKFFKEFEKSIFAYPTKVFLGA